MSAASPASDYRAAPANLAIPRESAVETRIPQRVLPGCIQLPLGCCRCLSIVAVDNGGRLVYGQWQFHTGAAV